MFTLPILIALGVVYVMYDCYQDSQNIRQYQYPRSTNTDDLVGPTGPSGKHGRKIIREL